MDAVGLAALGAVGAEWLVLGWLSGVGWPRAAAVWWAPRWALRLLVGAVLVALAQLVLALTPLGFRNPALVLALSAAAAGGLRWLTARGSAGRGGDRRLRWSAMAGRERVGWLVLGGLLLAAALRSLSVPEAGWDAFSHWGLRAHAYAVAGSVVSAGSEHEYYPPLVPLLEAWLSLHRGTGSLDLMKTAWAMIGGAFGICLAWHLRLGLSRAWLAPVAAAGVVLATPGLLEGTWTGQADLPLTAWLTLATLAAWRYWRAGDRDWLVQAAVFGGAAALTKLEGLPSVAVVVLALVLVALPRRVLAQPSPVLAQPSGVVALTFARAMPLAVALLGAGLAAALLWTAVAAHAAITPNREHFGHFQPQALGDVVLSLLAVFGGVRSGGGLAVAVLLWLVAGPRRLLGPDLRLLSVVVLGLAAATLLAFLISDAEPALEVRTSASRLVEHWLPLAFFAAVVALDHPLTRPCAANGSPVGARTATYNRRGR